MEYCIDVHLIYGSSQLILKQSQKTIDLEWIASSTNSDLKTGLPHVEHVSKITVSHPKTIS
jgi:hypothetical protein